LGFDIDGVRYCHDGFLVFLVRHLGERLLTRECLGVLFLPA
jgi:hypothetical protein